MIDSTVISTLQNKWDQRYQHITDAGNPCWVLNQHRHLLPSDGKALDLACGLGANALLLAQSGLESHGWDISPQALKKLSEFALQQNLIVHTKLQDIEKRPPPANSFDVIVVSQFLYRPIFPALISALKSDGLLFYQTFHSKKLTSGGPSSSEFLLKPNELLSLLSPLELVFYREDADIGQPEEGLRDCSYFIGKK
jgi:tellurite methyltransferase